MIDTLTVWAPFLVLIGVWIFVWNRQSGIGSPYQRTRLAEMQTQNELQKETNHLLDRIASALEVRNK